MVRFKELLSLLHPSSLLEGTNLRGDWHAITKKKFIRRTSWLLGIGALAYIFHYPFVDLPAGKKPESLWLCYRAGMALVALVTLGWYQWKSLGAARYSKIPAFIAFSLFNYFQGQTMVWHKGTPFFFSYVMASVLAIIIGDSMISIFGYFTIFLGLHLQPMLATEVPRHLIISYSFMFYGIIILVSSSYKAELQVFLSERKVNEAEKRNIEITMEFTSIIQSFLPKEILKRYRRAMERGQTSPMNALEDVLQKRKLNICCIYSDIRNYTQKSKDITFFTERTLKEIKSLHKPIEEFGGIARKIGDLMFAYFDGQNLDNNILRCICSSIEALELHIQFNENTDQKIERRFVITSGESICGNIGFFDSLIEITALGSPVNLAARIDELTKKENIKLLLNRDDLILSSKTKQVLGDTIPKLNFRRIDLQELKCQIRDFPEETDIFLLKASQENYQLIVDTVNKASSVNLDLVEAV